MKLILFIIITLAVFATWYIEYSAGYCQGYIDGAKEEREELYLKNLEALHRRLQKERQHD